MERKAVENNTTWLNVLFYYVGILPACMHDVVVRYFCIQKYSYKYLLRNINQKMKWGFRYLSSRKRIGIYEAIIVGRLLCSITSRYYNMAASASWLFWGWWWRKNTTASVYIWVWPHPHKHAAHRRDTRHVVLHVAEAVAVLLILPTKFYYDKYVV